MVKKKLIVTLLPPKENPQDYPVSYPPLKNLRLDLLENSEKVKGTVSENDQLLRDVVGDRVDIPGNNTVMPDIKFPTVEEPGELPNFSDVDTVDPFSFFEKSAPEETPSSPRPYEEIPTSPVEFRDTKIEPEITSSPMNFFGNLSGELADGNNKLPEELLFDDKENADQATDILKSFEQFQADPVVSDFGATENRPEEEDILNIPPPDDVPQPEPIKETPEEKKEEVPPPKPQKPPKTEEELEHEARIKWRWQFKLLRDKWPNKEIPEVTQYQDSKTLSNLYNETIRQLVFDNNVENYKYYCIIALFLCEFLTTSFFKFRLGGLTEFHIQMMHKYNHLFIELGEESAISLSPGLPAWMKLIGFILFNTLIFWLIQYAQSKGHAGILDTLYMVTGDKPKRNASAPKPEEEEAPKNTGGRRKRRTTFSAEEIRRMS